MHPKNPDFQFNPQENTAFLHFAKICNEKGIQWTHFKSPEETFLLALAYEKTTELISPARENINVLDLGCGNSLPGIHTLLNAKKNISVTGADVDRAAIDISIQNARSMGLHVEERRELLQENGHNPHKLYLVHGDLLKEAFKRVASKARYDIVGANLPYLPDMPGHTLPLSVAGVKHGVSFTPEVPLEYGESTQASIVTMNFSSLGNPTHVLQQISKNRNFTIQHAYGLICPFGDYTGQFSDEEIGQHWPNSAYSKGREGQRYQIIFNIIANRQSSSTGNTFLPQILHDFQQDGLEIKDRTYGNTKLLFLEHEEFQKLYKTITT